MVFSKAQRPGLVLAVALFGFCAGLNITSPSVTRAQDTYEPPEVTIPSSNPYTNNKEAIKEGAKIYFKFCIACHGPIGDGSSVFGKLGADLRVFWRGYAEFIVIVTAGRADKGMPPWGQFLDGVQVAKVGAYLETIAKPGANWK